MISTAGMSPMLALTLIQRERETFEKGVRNDALAKREIEAFQSRIGTIETVDDLMKDYEVFSFVMKAFGMEEQVYAKAMIKKIVTSDSEDKMSLVNKLTSGGYRDLHETLGFDTEGKAEPGRFGDADWVSSMVDRFVGQRLIDTQSSVNGATGDGLAFLRDAPEMTNWYKVLANRQVFKVVRVALGLPASIASGDIDAQKKLLESKMDIKDLQDPEKVQGILKRYAAIESANQAIAAPVGIMTLFNSSTSHGTWAPITLDMDAVASFRGYRR